MTAESGAEVHKQERIWGWEVIARHLGISPPTAKKYANQHGMPVHRRGGRYYAYREELDQWEREQEASEWTSAEETLSEQPMQEVSRPSIEVPDAAPRLRPTILLLVPFAAISALTIYFLTVHRSDDRLGEPEEPSAIEVQVATFNRPILSALDRNGKTVWDASFPDHDPRYNILSTRDVDGDGKNEVLFSFWPIDHRSENGRLICFDDTGEVLWDFAYGKPLTVGERYFEPFYGGFEVEWLSTPVGSWILVIANHSTWYPTQVALLEPARGAKRFEYFHPGRVKSTFFDVDGDGAKELLLGGVNNPGHGLGYPSLAVLEVPFPDSRGADNFFGSSNHRESTYLLFPRPDLFEARDLGVWVHEINRQGPDRIMVAVGSPNFEQGRAVYLVYYLDSSFRVVDLRAPDHYITEHNQLYRKGMLDHLYSPEELEEWKRVLVFPTAPDANSEGIRRRFDGGDPRSPTR